MRAGWIVDVTTLGATMIYGLISFAAFRFARRENRCRERNPTSGSLSGRSSDWYISGFALVILDVNDLKKVNDIQGHKAGDQYIRNACKLICGNFKRSPVFRIGGDEYAVVVDGDDYQIMYENKSSLKAKGQAPLA